MRAVIQRAKQASVTVDGEVVGQIGSGLCVLIGVTHGDSEVEATKLATKLWKLRIFPDSNGKMNNSLAQTTGEILLISQFTLYGDAAKGNRPSFMAAAEPALAEALIETVVAELIKLGAKVATGVFGADMLVALENDGPVTIILDL